MNHIYLTGVISLVIQVVTAIVDFYALRIPIPPTFYLINDFKSLKFSIFLDLVSNFKIKVLLNILISFFKLDLIFLSNKKNIISNNPNLSLLAIDSEFQSKGIGKIFIEKVLSEYNFKNRFHQITVETNNLRTENFYKEKVNFVYLGKKIRLFKNLKVFLKDLR